MSEKDPSFEVTSGEERQDAHTRYNIIGPYLDGDCSQVELSRTSGLSVKTLQRWGQRYREQGLRGLGRLPRSGRGTRRGMPEEQCLLIEGLAGSSEQRGGDAG